MMMMMMIMMMMMMMLVMTDDGWCCWWWCWWEWWWWWWWWLEIGEGGNLSLDYGAEAINSQNSRQTSKPLFQKTPPCLEFKNQNHFCTFWILAYNLRKPYLRYFWMLNRKGWENTSYGSWWAWFRWPLGNIQLSLIIFCKLSSDCSDKWYAQC